MMADLAEYTLVPGSKDQVCPQVLKYAFYHPVIPIYLILFRVIRFWYPGSAKSLLGGEG